MADAEPGRRAGPGAGPVLALAALLLAAAPSAAQEMTEVRTARRDVGAAERLRVEVEYAAGTVTVGRADPGYLYQQYLRYDASRFEPTREWSREDGAGRLRLGMESSRGEGPLLRWDGLDLDLGLRGLEDLGEVSSELELGLSRTVPTDLEMSIGAAEAALRLGGIPLTSLALETGASETELAFDRPNPASMEELRIEAGAASLRTRGLGNARFGELRVQGGVGDLRLDFTGDWTRDATARVDVGLGSLRIVVPEDLGVRIRRESFLASFDVPGGFERDGSGYRSENWSSAEHRLTLEVAAALGSVRVTVRD